MKQVKPQAYSVTLTEIEVLGLNSSFNLADGHAYHDLSPTQLQITQNLDGVWTQSIRLGIKKAEENFKQSFIALAAAPSITGYTHYSLSPTASNSIDIVAAWLAEEKYRVALVEPTFDNLYLLLKRRGVKVSPIAEASLFHPDLFHELELSLNNVDAIVLVNPNNPTGRYLDEARFKMIVEYCARKKKILVLDNTFRFFVPQTYDQYAVLLESGIQFCCIEDTGKVWPTLDMKVSLIVYSEGISRALRTIYEELYLCISSFTLNLLSLFLQDAHSRGLEQAVFQEIRNRRNLFRTAIGGSGLKIANSSLDSKISVEWTQLNSNHFADDLAALAHFRTQGLIVLPGRNFFWNSSEDKANQCFIRCSLLKPREEFLQSLNILNQGRS